MSTHSLTTLSTLLIAIIATTVLGSCGMSAADRAEQRRLDSIYTADSIRDAHSTRDSLMLADSLAEANFTSPDLRTFWLRGRVRQVVETTDGAYTIRLTFDEKGNLVSHSAFNTDSSRILRNGDDRIISMINIGAYDGGDEGQEFKYAPDGYPSAISHWAQGHDSYVFTLTNAQGWPTEGSISDAEDLFTGRVSYSYPSIDTHGNWTKQVSIEKWPEIEDTRHTLVRKIEYYQK